MSAAKDVKADAPAAAAAAAKVVKKPYGAWKSPVSSAFIAESSIGLVNPQVCAATGDVYWVEGRPMEKGRRCIVRYDGKEKCDVLKAPFASRSGVHEYGGGDYLVLPNGDVVFSNSADQRLYLQRKDGKGVPIALSPETAKPMTLRYVDAAVDVKRERVFVVHETHPTNGDAHAQPTNSLVWLSLVPTPQNVAAAAALENAPPPAPAAAAGPAGPAGPAAPKVIDESIQPRVHTVASGHDFYAAPRINPAGTELCFIAWNHPNMPWDATALYTVQIAADGSLGAPVKVAGGEKESITQPSYGPDGALYFVSDRTNWWNLYRRAADAKEIECVVKHSSEFAYPQWVFGNREYAFVDANTLLAVHFCESGNVLSLVDVKAHTMTDIDLPFSFMEAVSYRDGRAVFLASAPAIPLSVVAFDLATKTTTYLRSSVSIDVSQLQGYLSVPRPVEFPTENNTTAFAFFYPPANKDFAPKSSEERPPLLVKIHGGPTAHTNTRFRLDIQYWTSRGFAVLDVNYGGSTGYGRHYRERLQGAWGVVDVDDCCNGALFCVAQGWADRNRLAITGGSAGGFTALAALTFRPGVFRTGASHYGVADLNALAADTHKFEARYLDSLVAPYDEAGKAVYNARSPVLHVAKLNSPVALFQGLDDKVVPPNQTALMYDSVKAKGLPVSVTYFEGEGHGFRQAKNIRAALDGEFYFYSRLFGYEPADKMDSPPRIDNPGYPFRSELRTGLAVAHGIAALATLWAIFNRASK